VEVVTDPALTAGRQALWAGAQGLGRRRLTAPMRWIPCFPRLP